MEEKTLVIHAPVLKQGFTPVPIAVLTARGLSIEAKGGAAKCIWWPLPGQPVTNILKTY
ncbi:MAG: hypothetical protein K6U74_12060 [Firmicutes bacterium]|nr:hypothetical protein [Bacillota bacterium]